MIQERAMLARLSISQWTGKAFDKKVSTEVERAHGAHDAGRFNKALVNKALLEPISKLAGEVRKHHYSVTLPWSDSGERLLPAKLFMDYGAQMRGYRTQMDALVSNLVAAYPAEVQAARNRLGTMYDPADYPDPSDIRDAFGLTFEFTPVPDAKDFRVDVSNEAAEEIRTSINQAVCTEYCRLSCAARRSNAKRRRSDITSSLWLADIGTSSSHSSPSPAKPIRRPAR